MLNDDVGTSSFCASCDNVLKEQLYESLLLFSQFLNQIEVFLNQIEIPESYHLAYKIENRNILDAPFNIKLITKSKINKKQKFKRKSKTKKMNQLEIKLNKKYKLIALLKVISNPQQQRQKLDELF